MNKWKVTYINDNRDLYIYALTFNEAVSKITFQNWNQDNAYILKVELVEYVTDYKK